VKRAEVEVRELRVRELGSEVKGVEGEVIELRVR